LLLLAARVPLQSPLAAQPTASVDDQVTVALLPKVMASGLTEMVTVGAGETCRVAELLAVPPVPEHVSVYV